MNGIHKLQPIKSVLDLTDNTYYGDDHKKTKPAAISKAMATSMALNSVKKQLFMDKPFLHSQTDSTEVSDGELPQFSHT